MKYTGLLFSFLLVTVVIQSCHKKDNETKPAETQADPPFSCMFGNTFIKRTDVEALYWRDDKGLYIRASDSLVSNPQDIHISLINFTGNSTININESNRVVSVDILQSGETWYAGFSGTVVITRFDTVQNIVSGTFSCNLAKFGRGPVNPQDIIPLGDTISIRSGKFEVPFIAL